MTPTPFPTAAVRQMDVVNSQEPSCAASGRALTEYGEIIADIERGPQRSFLTVLRLVIAGQYAKPTRH